MLKGQKGAVTIIIAMVVLSAILLIAIAISNLIFSSSEMERMSYSSYKSFYASEAGVEFYLYYLIRSGGGYTPTVGDEFNFTLANGSSYRILVVQTSPSVIFKSIGEHEGTKRAIEIDY